MSIATQKNSVIRNGLVLGAAFALIGTLVGCAAEPTDEPAASTEVSTDQPVPAEEPAEPATQDASCGWDVDPAAWSGDLPTGQEGDLADVLIGAWQHASFDSGSGYEPMDTADTRYIFPSDGGMLYCQHVEGITDHAEQSAKITLEGNLIRPPSPHAGFEALAWDSNTMVWLNNYDGSNYVLVRR